MPSTLTYCRASCMHEGADLARRCDAEASLAGIATAAEQIGAMADVAARTDMDAEALDDIETEMLALARRLGLVVRRVS